MKWGGANATHSRRKNPKLPGADSFAPLLCSAIVQFSWPPAARRSPHAERHPCRHWRPSHNSPAGSGCRRDCCHCRSSSSGGSVHSLFRRLQLRRLRCADVLQLGHLKINILAAVLSAQLVIFFMVTMSEIHIADHNSIKQFS